MTTITNLPSIRPMVLDFANSGRVDPRVQCVRSGSASYYGSDGRLRIAAANEIRVNHDLNGKRLGLLVEETRTNILVNSVMAGTVAGTPGTAPTSWGFGVGNGTTSFKTFNGISTVRLTTSTIARHFLTQTNVSLAVGRYFITIDARFYTTSRFIDAFTLSVSTAEATILYYLDGSLATSNTVIPTGIHKLMMVVDVTAAGLVAPRIGVGVSASAIGDMEFTAPQIELGSFATSFIPTTTAAVTRGNENLTMDYNPSVNGAVVVSVSQFNADNPNNAYTLSMLNSNDNNGTHVYLYYPNTGNTTNWWVNSNSVGASGGNIPGKQLRHALVYSDNAKTASIVSGAVSASDTTRPKDFPDSINKIYFGRSRVNSNYLNGCIERIVFYSGVITNEQAQRLTTL